MANKKIFEFPPLTFAELDNDLILWAVGNPEITDGSLPLDPVQGVFLPGQLFKVTIAQLKQFFDNSGSPQSWQQVLDISSTLNKSNTIAGAGFHFFFTNMKLFIDAATAVTEALNARLNIKVESPGLAPDLGIRVVCTRNTSYFTIQDDPQPGNGGGDAINHSLYNKDGALVYWLTGRWLQYGATMPVQLYNGGLAVNNTGSTKSLILQSNTIVSWNDDMVFNHQTVVTIVERMRLTVSGQLALGTAAPNASAKLQVDSTTQGLLLPRMTKAQRDAIASPVAGLMVYQTDNTPGLRTFNGTNWMRYTETAD